MNHGSRVANASALTSGGTSTTEPKKASWPREAAEDWDERFGYGTAPAPRIGAGLKRVVEKYGWAAIRPAWRRYLAEKDAEFANPQDFAQKLLIWLDKNVPKGPAARREERSREVMLEWLKKHGGDE